MQSKIQIQFRSKHISINKSETIHSNYTMEELKLIKSENKIFHMVSAWKLESDLISTQKHPFWNMKACILQEGWV